MGRRRVRTLNSTGAILGATAMALVASPAAADSLPSLRAVPSINGISKATVAPAQAAPVKAPTSFGHLHAVPTSRSTITHVVKSGDTVWALAQRHNTTVARIISANELNSNALIRVGQRLVIPTAASSTTKPTTPKPSTPKPSTAQTYTVKPGDSLSAIAARHKTTTAALAKLNKISNPNFIRVGQVLRLEAAGATAPSTPSQPSTPTPSKPTAPSTSTTYTVKSGDTVWAIAAAHKVSTAAIIDANGLGAHALIRVGQKLTIPGASSGNTSTPAPQTPNACKDLVPSTFLHYTYPDDVVAAANANKCTLNAMDVPSRTAMQQMVREAAIAQGVDPALAQAVAYQESGFNQRAVSPANAIGTMQVIPSSGEWAGQLLGRKINLLNPQDNVDAGVAILRALQRTFPNNLDNAIGSYYQGAGSVSRYGLAADTRRYVDNVKSLMSRYH